LADTAICIQGLTKRFGQMWALDGVDLTVAPGEILALLGPNGAGKSTLLRILATTVIPDGGTATIDGFDVVTEAKQVRRRLGITLGDERSWYWRLSGRKNLEFFAMLYGFSRREAVARAAELLDDLELTYAADRRFDGYSTGMRMRLSLARALLPNPPVLLLDEPTRSLDPVAAASFRGQVATLAQERGKAILLTTHDLHEASGLAHRTSVLMRGRIVGNTDAPVSAPHLEEMLLTATYV